LKDLQFKLDEERELWNTIENQNKIIDKIQGGERDPMAIYNQLGGKVTFDEVSAITDTYKDEENRVEEAIGFALQTGEATQDEVGFMNDTARSFAERKTAAYRVIGRVAQADRALDRSYKSAQIANVYDQINARKDKIKADAAGGLDDIKNDAQKAVSLLSLISDLEQHRDLEAATGLSSYLYYEPGGGVEEFSRTHGQLKDTMTLDNLGLMKGVLSETDIQILASAATKLNRGLPTSSYIGELGLMKSNILASEEFNTAIDLGYINPTDLAIAMNFSNEDIADMKELGVISTEIEIQDYSSTDPQSYYGIR
jgi:hypothetical protein